MRSLPDDNALYEYLFDAFHDGIFLLEGREGKLLAGNQRAWEILSVAASEVIGKKILSLAWKAIHEDGSPYNTEEYPVAYTLRTGLPQRDQVMGLVTGSELKWLSVSSFPIRGERVHRKRLILLSFFDITGIKTAEHQARSNEYLFQRYLDHSSFPAWIGDKEGNISFMNEIARKIWKINMDYKGKNIYDLFQKEIADEFLESDRSVWESGQPLTAVVPSLLENGKTGYYKLNKFLLPLPDGKVMIAGQAIDITEEKRLEQLLLEKKVREQKKISREIIHIMDSELDGLATELHDHINQVLASADILLEQALLLDGEQKNKLIRQSKSQVHAAIDELRDISRNLDTKAIRETGLFQTITDIVEVLKKTYTSNIRFSCKPEIDIKLPVPIKQMVYRIVQEQVSNIVRHAGANRIRIKLLIKNKILYLTISDNGRGFNPAHVKKGEGLKNIRQRVEVKNGKYEMDAIPGKGCTLKINVPVEDADEILF